MKPKADNKNVNFPTQFLLQSISNKFDAVESREVSLKGNRYDVSVNNNTIDTYEVLAIHKCLMVKIFIYLFIGFLGFSRSLTNIANVSSLSICMSLNNQLCMARPTFIDLNPDEYNQGLFYYQFMVKKLWLIWLKKVEYYNVRMDNKVVNFF